MNTHTHTYIHTEEGGGKFNVTCNFFRRVRKRDLGGMGISLPDAGRHFDLANKTTRRENRR